MTPELTKEKVMEMGKLFGRRYPELLPPKGAKPHKTRIFLFY